MMNKDEQIQNLSKIARISVSYAEDLYDFFFPKPVVPQYVADWYEENKEDFETNLFNDIYNISNVYPGDNLGEFADWLMADDSHALITLVNMHQFGYEVEKETRYTVKMKGIFGHSKYLNRDTKTQVWFFASNERIDGFRVRHTRKELEDADFGWVFSCEGVEVIAVDE